MRSDFNQVTIRTLANRVGLLCSNPECRSLTSGPKSNAEQAINVGVAAHITAASTGGPRFDPSLPDLERRATANGIWLCQTCAKLIDSDEARYTVELLARWKKNAEQEASKRLGKTNSKPRVSERLAEQEVKRNHRLRDELRAAFTKPWEELKRSYGPGKPQYAKFKEREFVVHRLDDTRYPEFDEGSGISNWFKLGMFDFYHNGIEGILDIEYALVTTFTKSWSSLPYERKVEPFPEGFWPIKVMKTGRIPFRNIRHCDLAGDEFYVCPHLYCLYADDGMPYEAFEYYQLPEGRDEGYLFSIPLDGRVPLEKLLALDPTRQDSWEYLK